MPQATQPMTPDQGYAVLVQKVYIPAFIEKLAADYGIQIDTQEQLEQALTRAAQLRELYNAEQQKQASSHVDELTAFGAYMDQTLVSNGLVQPAATPQIVKQAAARGASDPELAHAILSMAVAANQSA